MSVQVKRRREAASFLSTFIGAVGEILFDTTNNRLIASDGSTPGGFPAAKLSEVPCAPSAHEADISFGVIEEEIPLTGASTNSTIQIPARAIVFGVTERVTLAVTGAPGFSVGVSGTPAQFGGTGLSVSLGSTNVGVIGPTAFYSATNIVITADSGSFTGGKVRIAIHYMLCGAPTS